MSYREELHFLKTKGKIFDRVRMKFMWDKLRMNSTYGKFGVDLSNTPRFDKSVYEKISQACLRYTPEPLPRHRSGIYAFMFKALRRVVGWL